MTTAYLNYCTTQCLPCAGSSAPDVILCLIADIAAAQTCPEVEQTYQFPFLEASICQFYSTGDGCNRKVWHYTFSYDTEDLATPNVPLQTGDITGIFCKDCLTSWVEAKAGDGVKVTINEDDTYRITNQFGCTYDLSTFVAGDLVVSDTDSVDLTYVGNTLSADSKISATSGNLISITGDGLYVDINVTDTATVDLTLSGAQEDTISADVNISADAGNIISAHGDGLFAEVHVDDTTSIDLTLGALNTISGDVIVSADANNLLSIESDGLFVPALDGWIPILATLTYVNSTTVSTSVDLSGFIGVGDRIKFVNSSTKYLNVYSISSTQIVLYGGSDYAVQNSAITAPFFSHEISPKLFPGEFNWTPALTANGAMTITDVVNDESRFWVENGRCYFETTMHYTLGGTQDTFIFLSTPIPGVVGSEHPAFIYAAEENTTPISTGRWRLYELDATKLILFKAAVANWTLGTNAGHSIQGSFKIA